MARGYWEAKDSHDDLDAEIRAKLKLPRSSNPPSHNALPWGEGRILAERCATLGSELPNQMPTYYSCGSGGSDPSTE